MHLFVDDVVAVNLAIGFFGCHRDQQVTLLGVRNAPEKEVVAIFLLPCVLATLAVVLRQDDMGDRCTGGSFCGAMAVPRTASVS